MGGSRRPRVGGFAHLTWWEGADCHNVDAWESEAAYQAFVAERLGPAIAQVGVNVEPQVAFPVRRTRYPCRKPARSPRRSSRGRARLSVRRKSSGHPGHRFSEQEISVQVRRYA